MMVERKRTRFAITVAGTAAALFMALPVSLQAQYMGGGTKTAAEVQVADLEAMRDKFLGLAEEFPEDLYDWRPMEGVRSVQDVYALMIAECNLFPGMWGFESPGWIAGGGFGPEMQRVQALSKAEVMSELGRSFNYIIELSRDLAPEDRAREVEFFGLTVDLGTALTLMQNDMHEHLGQSIAYARMNRIVPPWSREQ